jgi:hypothetical protein
VNLSRTSLVRRAGATRLSATNRGFVTQHFYCPHLGTSFTHLNADNGPFVRCRFQGSRHGSLAAGERVECAALWDALRDSAWCGCQPIIYSWSRPAQSPRNSCAPDMKPAAATRSLSAAGCARVVYAVPTSGRRPASAPAGPASLSRFPCCLLPGGTGSCRREQHLGVFRC